MQQSYYYFNMSFVYKTALYLTPILFSAIHNLGPAWHQTVSKQQICMPGGALYDALHRFLPRRSSLSECRTFSRYTCACNFISTSTKNAVLPLQILAETTSF